MKTFYLLLLSAGLAFSGYSQTALSGIINSYAAVESIEPCNGRLELSTINGFEAGQAVIIIQMKGATIDESNSSNFGAVTNLGTAGRYEMNRIATVGTNEVFLEFELLYDYDLSAQVQIVTFPEYEDAEVVTTLTAPSWDGLTGGIIAFHVSGTLTLSAPIDVSGTGFRGGNLNVVNSDCQWFLNQNDYYYGNGNWRGAPKGEGIAAIIQGKEKGRGPQANGGGGGNDHNAGGGGGSNNTSGGLGGENTPSSVFGCSGQNPGIGGRSISPASLRLWPGGGGGAGHTDDNGAGSAGGRGGGVVLIKAGNLVGNSQWIRAAGQDAPQANGDGAGGGGGAGAIVLDIDNSVSPANIDIRGGDGGNVSNISTRCDGPGGGGSGGRLLVGNPLLVDQVQLQGGNNGINLNPSSVCDTPGNGAGDGDDGLQSPYSSVPEATVPLEPVTFEMNVPSPIPACLNTDLEIEILVTGVDLTYQWQVNTGTGFYTNLMDGADYSGTQTPALTVFDLDLDQEGYAFRCIIQSDCYGTLISTEGTLDLQDVPTAGFDVSADALSIDLTDLSTSADSVIWYFGDGQTSNEHMPSYTYANGGTYTILQIVSNFCGVDSASAEIQVFAPPSAGFLIDNDSPCVGDTVFFTNQSEGDSLSFNWQFPGGTPESSGATNAFTVYDAPGTYSVTLIVSNPAGADTLTLSDVIEVESLPQGDYTLSQNGYTIDVDTLNVSNNTQTILWEFGDGTSSSSSPASHTYDEEGFYLVNLSLTNVCGTVLLTDTIAVGAPPVADFNVEFTGGCTPLTVFYTSFATGDNISHEWIFPGGDPATSTEPMPEVTYNDPGLFDVTLIVSNNLGADTLTIEEYMEVLPLPEAMFSVTTSGDTAFFTNLTMGSNLTFEWDFGDGNTSSATNPTHIYDGNDTYEVTLLVTNTYCGDVATQFVQIGPNSIQEIASNPYWVYPNPSSGLLIVEGERKPARILVYDVLGRLKLEQRQPILPFEMDAHGWENGTYWVVIDTEEGRETFRWIKAE
jgi:PKD repeat protein